MTNLVGIGLIYGLISLGAAATLFFSFRGRIDKSAQYFLSAELLMIFSNGAVIWANLDPANANPVTFFATNVFVLLADGAIFLSMTSLKRPAQLKYFLLWALFTIGCCFLIEYSRSNISPSSPIAIHALLTAAVAWATYKVCVSTNDSSLQANQFLKWFGYLELALIVMAGIRLVSFFASTGIAPRNPTTVTSIYYAVFLSLSVFRYVTYQSLRMSWVDPNSDKGNLLNKTLVTAVNERDQLLKSLLDSNRMIGVGALAATLSHELSQPLTSITFQTESVRRNLLEGSQVQESINSLDKVNAQLFKLSSLVRNLRQLFNSNANQFTSIQLVNAIEVILEIIEPNLKLKNIKLNKDYLSNPTVYGDSIQLQQVLINIFNNAIDAIELAKPSDREITLVVRIVNKTAIVTVEDSGNGIPPETLPIIFDLYRTTKKEGLGVGLWLCKTILNRHQAAISAANSKTRGAVFTIEFPLYLEPKS